MKPTSKTTLYELLPLLEEHLKDRPPSSRTSIKQDIKTFGRFIGQTTPLGQVTTAQIEQFLVVQKEQYAKQTVTHRAASLRIVFRWLVACGVLTADPAAAIPVDWQIPQNELPFVLHNDEIERLRQSAQHAGKRAQVALLLLLDTGMKQNELVNLCVEDIQTNDQPCVEIWQRGRLQYLKRTLALSRKTLALVQEYAQGQELHGKDKLFPFTAKTLQNDLGQIGTQSGLVQVTCRSLRWSVALKFFQEGMEPELLRRKLGLKPKRWRDSRLLLERLAGV